MRNVTYHNPIHQEENTPLVTILETDVSKKQSTAIDSRNAPYAIDLSKASFGGTTYPEPGSQWYLKKISGVWALMARAPQQNPQLDPGLTPQVGDTLIGHGGTISFVGDLEVNDDLTVNGDILVPDKTNQLIFGAAGSSTANVSVERAATSDPTFASHVTGDTQQRFQIKADGTYGWGDGSSAQDTNLYRSAANTLKTDDAFIAVGGIVVKTVELDPAGSATSDVLRYNGTKYVADSSVAMIGEIKMWPTIAAPTNWQLCDGSSLSRTTYATLFSLLQPSIGTMTISIASPAVVSFTGHGLSIGARVFFTTTGALPTGVSANTTYWVISAGFGANSFEIATSQDGTAINTSGSQSGVHTLLRTYFGVADSTHFNVPDFRGRVPVGRDSSQTEFAAIGITAGEKTHVLTAAEMPTHTHTTKNYAGTVLAGAGAGTRFAASTSGASSAMSAGSDQSNDAGSDGAHNNLQPSLAINYIIRLL